MARHRNRTLVRSREGAAQRHVSSDQASGFVLSGAFAKLGDGSVIPLERLKSSQDHSTTIRKSEVMAHAGLHGRRKPGPMVFDGNGRRVRRCTGNFADRVATKIQSWPEVFDRRAPRVGPLGATHVVSMTPQQAAASTISYQA